MARNYYAQFERHETGDYVWIGEEPTGRPRSDLDHILWFKVDEWTGIIAQIQREIAEHADE